MRELTLEEADAFFDTKELPTNFLKEKLELAELMRKKYWEVEIAFDRIDYFLKEEHF